MNCGPPTASQPNSHLRGDINASILNNIKELLKTEFENFKREMREFYLAELAEVKENFQSLSNRINHLEDLVEGSQLSVHMDLVEEQIIEEMEDRKSRSNNLMLFNLEEPNNDATTDTDLANDILGKIIPCGSLPIRTMRLGKRLQGRSRPLRVSLPSSQDVMTILRNKMKYSGPVRITQDQTLKQRNYFKDIQAKLKALKDAGESDKTIRYINGVPKIVDVKARAKSKN